MHLGKTGHGKNKY